MFSFTRRTLTEEQSRILQRKCGSTLRAFNVCSKANAKDPSPCVYLENAAITCMAEICCQNSLKPYEDCVKKSTDENSFKKCDTHMSRMKRCLGRYGKYPI